MGMLRKYVAMMQKCLRLTKGNPIEGGHSLRIINFTTPFLIPLNSLCSRCLEGQGNVVDRLITPIIHNYPHS